MRWQDYFKGKKVTLMGLGLLGRGVDDAEFLARYGAELVVTDLKTEKELEPSIARLRGYKNVVFHLGWHRMEDFIGRDFILKAAGVPIDSPFIAEARKNNVPIEMDASLFVKLAPKITTVGITGTRGKSTTTMLIYEILKAAGMRVFLAGNIRNTATLALLEKVNDGDYVVLELDSWQLQGFGEAKISPNISVFTTFMQDHMNYYGSTTLTTSSAMEAYFKDKAQIFRHQKEGDHLIVGEDIADMFQWDAKGTLHVATRADIPKEWMRLFFGEHNRLNGACAREVAEILGISMRTVRKVFNTFHGLAGRLELKRMINGVRVYNDNSSTTPDATLAALRAVGNSNRREVVLIIGGDDKQLDMSALVAEIPKWCSKVVLFKERGTDKIRGEIFKLEEQGIDVYEEEGLPSTVKRAFSVAVSGETVLYSPAFSSFGKWFKNEYDRGEQFVKIVVGL